MSYFVDLWLSAFKNAITLAQGNFLWKFQKKAFTTVRTHKSYPKVWESKRPDIASTLFNFEYDKNIFIEILTVIYKSLKT